MGDALGESERLQPLPDEVDLIELADAERGDARAYVRHVGHETLVVKALQRLPNRHPACVELLGHGLLADALAGSEPALDDLSSDPICNSVGEKCAFHPAR